MICPNCKYESPNDAIQCSECGYPFAGSPESKAKFIARQVIKSSEIVDSKLYLRNARLILCGVGLLNFIPLFFNSADSVIIIINICLSVLFMVFGIFLNHYPVVFVGVPFALILIIYLFDYVTDPMSLSWDLRSKFIVIKAMIIAGLAHGLRSAVLAERYRKESAYLSKQ